MSKVYISTPINGRPESNWSAKVAGAKQRIEEIRAWLKTIPRYEDYETVCSFDFVPQGASEAKAMGMCIQAVMECDVMFLDFGELVSRGCQLEHEAARIYGKPVIFCPDLKKGMYYSFDRR